MKKRRSRERRSIVTPLAADPIQHIVASREEPKRRRAASPPKSSMTQSAASRYPRCQSRRLTHVRWLSAAHSAMILSLRGFMSLPFRKHEYGMAQPSTCIGVGVVAFVV